MKPKHSKLLIFPGLILAGSIAALITAQSASADTIVSSEAVRIFSNNPNNTGDTGTLSLYNDGGGNMQRTFLQFNTPVAGANNDLTDYSGNSITTDATLTLRGIANYGGQLNGVSLGTANSVWTQGTLTWNNQPSLTAIPGATNPNGSFGNVDVTWTIPWYMLEKMATTGSGYNNSLGLTSTSGSSLHFNASGPTPKLTFSAATGASSTLTGTTGNWTNTANWAGSTVAQGISQTATISGGTAVNITMDANRSVGALSFSGANHTISSGAGKLALNVTSGSPTISVETGRIATIAATVVGLDGLTKTSAGTLTLSGANTYTGATTVNGGGLTLSTSGSIAAASNIKVNSGTLTVAADGGGRTLANNVVLNGGVIMVQVSEDNTGTGGTITFSGGNVIHTFTASGSLVLPTSIGSASELIVGGGGGGGAGVNSNVYNAGGGGGKVSNLTAQSLASGTTAVVVGAGGAGGNNASGTAGGASSIGGNTAAGGLGANDNNGTGGTSGSGNLGAGRNNGYFGGGGGGDSAAGSGTNGGAGTAGTITGSFYGGGGGAGPNGVGGVGGGGNGDGGGSPTAGTANTGGGGGGAGNSAAGGSGIAIVQYAHTAAGGALTLSGTVDLQSASTLDAYGATGSVDVTGLISTSTGSGGLTIASSVNSGGVVRFGSANTYLGNTTVNTGATLRMNTTNALPSGSGKGNLSLSGTLDLNGQATTSLNGLSGTGTINNNAGAGTYALSVGNNNQSSAFGGVIQNTTGTLVLSKTGTGTLALSGTNTYSGITTVNQGTLLVNGSNTGTGAVSVASGATLGGTGSIAGAVNVTGVLSPGASIQSFASGALTMTTGSTFAYEAANNTATGADLMVVNGALSLNGVTIDLSAANLGLGTWLVDDKLTLISYTGTAITSGFTGYTDDTIYTGGIFGTNQWLFNYDDTVAGLNYAGEASGTSFVTFTVVPEPDVALLIGSLGTVALLRRRRSA